MNTPRPSRDASPPHVLQTRRGLLDLPLDELLGLLDSRMPHGERWLVTLDGRSGSGKTSVCAALHARHPEAGVLHLDDLYPGWDGLAEGAHAARDLVEAWQRGGSPSYQPTQWPGMPPRHEATVDAARSLIVEGVGAAWAGHGIAAVSVWLEAERERRRARAIARDGDTFAPHWLTWESQETAWFAEHPDASQLVVRVTEAPAR